MKILYYLLITVNAAIIIYAIYRYKVLDKNHKKELDDLLDEIYSRDTKIQEHEKTIVSKKSKLAEENEEIANLISELKNLKEKLSSTIKENNSKIDNLTLQLDTKDKLLIKESKKNIELLNKLKEKDNKRIASVGTISSKQKKIDNLEKKINELIEKHKQELKKKDRAIEFLKTHRRAPSEEEIKAYDFQFKEVEKRIKEK